MNWSLKKASDPFFDRVIEGTELFLFSASYMLFWVIIMDDLSFFFFFIDLSLGKI